MVHLESILQRTRSGVTLSPPVNAPHPASVQSFMDLPVNIYFMDRNSVMQRMNERTAETSGYLSAKDAIGKSLRDVSKLETISHILDNDRAVVTSGRCKIDSESYIRHDGHDMVAVSFKFPWLRNNTIAGIFGCSILLDSTCGQGMSSILNKLLQTGLLTPAMTTSIPLIQLANIHFDQRDHEIMRLLVRGKTAKQIACVLALSYRTIEHRIENIKQKLRVTSKAELIECLVDELSLLASDAKKGS